MTDACPEFEPDGQVIRSEVADDGTRIIHEFRLRGGAVPATEFINGMWRVPTVEGRWLWQGSVNGTALTLFTTDPDLRPTMRGIATVHYWGAEMVDQYGNQLGIRVLRR